MRKITSVILIFLITSSCVFTITLAEDNKNLEDIRKEQSEIKENIDKTSDQLEEIKVNISENLNKVNELDEQISNLNIEILELEKEKNDLQKKIEKVDKKINRIENEYKVQKEQVDNRLLAIHETRDTKYLDVLLESKGIVDFISNYYLITEMAEHDMEMLEDINARKKEIESTRNELKKAEERFKKIKDDVDIKSVIYRNSKFSRELLIEELTEEEKGLHDKIADYNQKYDEVNIEILKMQGVDSEYIGGELAWPVPGYTRITSNYGMRHHPILHVNKVHTGVDISAPIGADFVAANDGIVTKASYNVAYGNMVIIDHGGGITTLYAHGSEILVQVGDIVKRGEPVLKVGSTGYSTGPHAHFEVRIDGQHTDPLPYITNGLIPKNKENIEEDKGNVSEEQ